MTNTKVAAAWKQYQRAQRDYEIKAKRRQVAELASSDAWQKLGQAERDYDAATKAALLAKGEVA